MKNTETDFITIGKIGATFGVQGWLKIHSYTEFSESILSYSPWYLSDNEKDWQPITIEDGQVRGNSILAKLPGVNSPEAARFYTNKIIAISRSQLPDLQKDEYYWSDLEGLTVINKDGTVLGTVAFLIETGANDVLVVKGEKEIAIPYLPEKVIKEINLVKREIHVDWELI